jgi:methylmalonyl-CoA/ethylmalonyl-CoA epimerase
VEFKPEIAMPVEALAGREVGQIGIIVRDLDQAVRRYTTLWGLGPWVIYTYGPETVPHMAYRGAEGTHSMRLALTGDSPQVELIEPLAGPSIYHEFIEESGYGIHHVGVVVDAFDRAAKSMLDAGYAIVQSGSGFGLDGDGAYAYFDTEADLDLILEIIERPRRRREPEAVWPEQSA